MSKSNGTAKPVARVVFEYDPETGNCRRMSEGPFPYDKLVNVLTIEIARCANEQLMLMAQAARQQVQQGIVGPDGRPPRFSP